MTIHESPAGTHEKRSRDSIRLLWRYQKEADELAAAKYFSAVIGSGVAALLFVLALCFAGRLPQMPWQAYVSVGLVVSGWVRQLWKAYFTAASRARECQQRLHEVTVRMASDTSKEI